MPQFMGEDQEPEEENRDANGPDFAPGGGEGKQRCDGTSSFRFGTVLCF
jgi:hypothetical protein